MSNNEAVEELIPNNINNPNNNNNNNQMENIDVSFMILIKNPNNEIVIGKKAINPFLNHHSI